MLCYRCFPLFFPFQSFKTSFRYTKALFASQIDPADFSRRVEPINGYVPKLVEPEDQCRFLSRCTETCDKCQGPAPRLTEVGPNHQVACWREEG